MNEQEKQTIYSVLVRLIESGETLTRLERRDLLNQLCMVNSRMTLDEILSVSENNRKLQIKRGTSLENDTYTGTSGEITMDTDTRTIRVHDGETAGGVALARISDIAIDQVIEFQLPNDENNHTWYRKYKSGWVEMGGHIKTNSSTIVAITFPIPFAHIPNVISNAFANGSSSGNWYGYPIQGTISNTGCSFSTLQYEGTFWQACGVAA